MFLLILAVIFRYNFGGFAPSFFLNTLLALLIFSISYTLYVYVRIKFVQDIDKRVITKGETVKLVVKLSNEDIIIYPFIHVSFFGSHTLFNSASYSQSLSITPLSKKEFVFDMECRYRGQYEVGISDIQIEDFLGLIRLNYRIPETKKIIVYPKIEHLGKFDVFTTNSFDSQNSSQGAVEDVNNIKDMRSYQYGDSFRKIHWKLSARNNSWMIKNYQCTSDANVNILIDLKENDYLNDITIVLEDKLIEAAVAVLNYYLNKGISVNYIYYEDKIEILKASNRHEFEFIYKTLSTISFNQKVPLSDIVSLHYESSSNTNDMIIITSILDVDLYNVIYKAQMSNHSICLIYVSPKTLIDEKFDVVNEILDILPEIGVRAYTINPDDDIKMILGG
ncbi:MAG: hypothetical protein K0R50_1416 [Eubacterium sp.]|nr:hypothetical protein [Eubacterium sp.]